MVSRIQIQIAGLAAENQRLSERQRSQNETHQRALRSAELRNQTLQQDLELARSELITVQTEFEGYKVSPPPISLIEVLSEGTEALIHVLMWYMLAGQSAECTEAAEIPHRGIFLRAGKAGEVMPSFCAGGHSIVLCH